MVGVGAGVFKWFHACATGCTSDSYWFVDVGVLHLFSINRTCLSQCVLPYWLFTIAGMFCT